MSVPGWYALILLVLAAFRVWRLLAEDTILEPLRARFVPADSNREAFIRCPWCLGFWVSLAWWTAWQAWPDGTLVAAVPFAISAVVGLVAANLDPAE